MAIGVGWSVRVVIRNCRLAGLSEWSTAALSIFAVALSGISTYKKGWIAVRNGNMNINALMSVAVTGALLIGRWQAAMVMVLFTISELIEAKSLDQTRNAIEGLLKWFETVTVSEQDGSWREVEANTIGYWPDRTGQTQESASGLDGKIIRGNSSAKSGTDHRRKPAGGKGSGRCRIRRNDQSIRLF